MPDIPPDLAGKVLSADLRNIVKKVGDGTPLSTAEHEMMQGFLASDTPPEELLKARGAALIRRWASGGKLSKDEQKEIADFLPMARTVVTRQTTETYKQSLRGYESVYTTNVRQIKRWIATGRKCAPFDLPPLDRPDAMAAWWERMQAAGHIKHAVPEKLLRYEQKKVDGSAPEAPAPGPPSPKTPKSPPPEGADVEKESKEPPLPPMQLDAAGNVSSDLGLQQVQSLVKATYKQMEIALERQNMTQYNSLRREWQQLVQILRSWEKDIIKIQEGRGEVLRTREINTELVRLFTTMGQSFFNALLKLAGDLAPEMAAEDRRQLAMSKRDEIYRHLKGSRFQSVWTAISSA